MNFITTITDDFAPTFALTHSPSTFRNISQLELFSTEVGKKCSRDYDIGDLLGA